MKKLSIFLACVLAGVSAYSGNPDRAGAAGASHLLVNPWARTGGLMGTNVASSLGSEAIFTNVAGMAFTKKTDILFTTTNYLKGSGINVGALGFSQKVGESSVLGLNVVSMGFGDIDITTTDRPEGGNGTFAPTMTNIGFSYAKAFSNSIYGGITFRYHQESIADVSGSGMAFDAGIRYVTGDRDNIRIGIALKNVGPPYRYGGDGVAIEATDDQGNGRTFFERTAGAELPSLIHLGAAYDFLLAEGHDLTINGSYLSNSFSNDQLGGSFEYSFKSLFQVRAGYISETSSDNAQFDAPNVRTGLSFGASVGLPINKNGGVIGIDYSYQATQRFDGIQSIGLNITL